MSDVRYGTAVHLDLLEEQNQSLGARLENVDVRAVVATFSWPAVAVAVVACGMFYESARYGAEVQQRDNLRVAVQALEKERVQQHAFNLRVSGLERIAGALDTLRKSGDREASLMRDILSALPPPVRVSKITADDTGTSITITGTSPNHDAVAQALPALRAIHGCVSVQRSNSEIPGGFRYVSYTIRMLMVAPSDGPT